MLELYLDEEQAYAYNVARQRRLAERRLEASSDEEGDEDKNQEPSQKFFLWLLVAIFFDMFQMLLSLIPFLGWLLSAGVGGIAWMTFNLWGPKGGEGAALEAKKLLSKKEVMNFLIKWAPAVEIIPLADVLPLWTVRILLQFAVLKAEKVVRSASGGKAV